MFGGRGGGRDGDRVYEMEGGIAGPELPGAYPGEMVPAGMPAGGYRGGGGGGGANVGPPGGGNGPIKSRREVIDLTLESRVMDIEEALTELRKMVEHKFDSITDEVGKRELLLVPRNSSTT